MSRWSRLKQSIKGDPTVLDVEDVNLKHSRLDGQMVSDIEGEHYLSLILKELRIMNIHLALINDELIDDINDITD